MDIIYGTIIIPALNPDHKLLDLLQRLQNINTIHRVILVDDGSKAECKQIFEEALERYGCIVLHHEQNQGKGTALKTAFHYIKEHPLTEEFIVTADADGQHTVEDMEKCLIAAHEKKNCLVLGCRNFKEKQVPFRSRFGNESMCFLMKLCCGRSVSDTQTGLRAFSFQVMEKLMNIPGKRFDYETNVLLHSKQESIELYEVSISTVYIENNGSSHFRPFVDSIHILSLFLRYMASACVSTMIDLLLFSLVTILLSKRYDMETVTVIATIGARVVSATVNYSLNKKYVFQQYDKRSFLKYVCLCVIQMGMSAFLVTCLNRISSLFPTIHKIIVDTILFLVNFVIQREWVFVRNKMEDEC